MMFGVKRSYKSLMTVPQIHECLEYFSSKTSSFFKAKIYDVQLDDYQFAIQKRGGSINGPVFPIIRGRIEQKEYVRVDLDIKPSYLLIAFCAIITCILLLSILLADKMTINGVYRMPTVSEKVLFSLFSVSISAILCYFKTIKPTKDAEKWLVRKFSLKEIAVGK